MRMRVLPLCLVIACALLFLFSTSCLSTYYGECLGHNVCGGFHFGYPFGKYACGDSEFLLDCYVNESGGSYPGMNIYGDKYRILKPDILGDDSNNNVMTIINDNLWRDKCNLSGNYSQFWWPGSHFHISADTYTNLTLSSQCDKSNDQEMHQLTVLQVCGDDWYYNIQNPEDEPRFCKTHLRLPVPIKTNLSDPRSINQILEQGFEITWHVDPIRYRSCGACLESSGICGYSYPVAVFFCYCSNGTASTDRCATPHGRKNNRNKKFEFVIVVGASFGGVALIATALLYYLKFYRKKRKQPPPLLSGISKVEIFLREYAYEMPTRYSQSELKEMTNNFAEKLGEGGFGMVYKGKLGNGVLVAVKLLDRHRHNDSAQFVNEVATVGRVHHVNLVRLLGYCFESFTSALVYEYMVNGSLEKFIFAGKEKGRILSREQLYSIALGAARGIAYLHQDCEKRIIHFDIKPHNILLDAEFTPKVSDFGLAKLCGKEDDHISVTAVRGTPGYVAPEVCDRHVGPVTDKSDVYSFGMLLLEIAGGRKNIDVQVSRSSRLYFPEWAFKMLQNEEMGMRLGTGRGGEIEGEDAGEKVRRLIKVGLWCVQYNSRDRPCMSRVVQMLEGNGDDVTNPPLPFTSSAVPEKPQPFTTESSCSNLIAD